MESEFWSFGYLFEEQKYRKAAIFIGEYIHYSVFFEVHCITALSCCLLIRHWGLYLSQLNDSFKSKDFNVFCKKDMEVLSDYNILEENIRLLKQTLSTPLFAILLSCSLNLYGALAMVLKVKLPPFLMAEYVMDVFMNIAVIFSLIICGSKIPDGIQQIKETAGLEIEKYKLRIWSRGKDIFFLERLEKKDVIFLSAGGMVDIKKGLMLSVVGVLFTYELVILNLE
ncbi:hypothetical protein AVEN_256443-1 [Araneus ventricosus]|uniref:Uncharacterized protein n=1 Tax=Araneus ventricosus TaxID=182803 RepID=A0A4Y2LP96_ARAVE|nr:hypothetical protein AVEN_256443-1 [Araneus ventricosus]